MSRYMVSKANFQMTPVSKNQVVQIPPPPMPTKCNSCGWDFEIPHVETLKHDIKRTRPITRSQIAMLVRENGATIAINLRCSTCYQRDLYARDSAQFSGIEVVEAMHRTSIRQDQEYQEKTP